MEEEIKECVNVEALKGNGKLSFFNWLGLCWAFYWRLFLVTCVCMILFLLFVLFLQYVFFWLSYFSPGSTVLPICFTLSKVISLIIALYLAVLVTVRWVLALYNKVFALRIIDSHDNHLFPLKEIKKTEWFKISWSFFWRHILTFLLLVIISVIINFCFIYLFKFTQSNPSLIFLYSTKAFFRFILTIVIVFIGLLITGLNIKWFLRVRYKRFKITVSNNHLYTGRNSHRWLIALLIFSFSYASFVTFSPWKEFVANGIKHQLATQTSTRQKPDTQKSSAIQKDISKKEFISKLFKNFKERRKLGVKWKKMSIESGYYNKNIHLKNEMLKIVSKLEILNEQVESMKVPKTLDSIKKLKNEYCIAYKKNIEILREFSGSDNLIKSLPSIKKKQDQIPVPPNEIQKEIIRIILTSKGINQQFTSQTTTRQKSDSQKKETLQKSNKKVTTADLQFYIRNGAFITKYVHILKTEKKLIIEWYRLGKKYFSKNLENRKIKKELLKIISRLEVLNAELRTLQVPKEIEYLNNIKHKYCTIYARYLRICRQMVEPTNSEEYYKKITIELSQIKIKLNKTLKKMMKILKCN